MGRKVAILGAGSWGVTLGKLLYENGHEVRVWCYLDEELEMLNEHRERIDILPGIRLSEDIVLSTDIASIVTGAELVLFVVPSFGVRNVAREAAPDLSPGAVAVSAAKGFEEITYFRMTEVLREELPEASGYVAFSGPSHAEEVSRGIPTAIVAAARDVQSARVVQDAAVCDFLRVYTNTDVIGVEVGAALKNVIAIAGGVIDGLGYGDNTKGALLTRGLAEIRRLGAAFGADPETFAGLSGLGDLITTCISKHSRNR
ncbi:MAG: NAD(P)-dependent glycerol-3-phosphate dehydrogenase, partial [bacterium]|nr:NAD(P)-dependent glycerol-3-phosphate dehydrogenase [bacterium]